MAGTWASKALSEPHLPDGAIRTRHTVRSLMLRGLDRGEATNLTAFLCGIPVVDRSWTLSEINRLLFLRELYDRGEFGPADARPPRESTARAQGAAS